MFSSPKKPGRDIAQRLVSGHVALQAYWALKHAGVLDVMLEEEVAAEGLDPRAYADRTRLAPEILDALINYAARAGLLSIKDGRAFLTADGRALMEENGVLEMVRAYSGVLDVLEHLLVRLKTLHPGNSRRFEAAVEAQSQRWLPEVYPAIEELIVKHRFTHLLDIDCGSGDLLIRMAKASNQIVGVGVGSDGPLVRKANAAITTQGLEKRFIAVTANSLDALTETKQVFDRVGISQQLWREIDCILAANFLGEATSLNRDLVIKTLAGVARNFPHAHLLLAEPTIGPKFDKNYYASELALVLQLTRQSLWTADIWRNTITLAGLKVVAETSLATDGLTLFLCTTP